MNEQEWLASEDPAAMFRWANTPGSCNGRPWSEWKPSDRKLRLFACAVARLLENGLSEKVAASIAVIEAFADGANPPLEKLSHAQWSCTPDGLQSMLRFATNRQNHSWLTWPAAAGLLGDIVGNPFKPAYVVHRNGSELSFDAETSRRTGKRCVSIGMLGKCILVDRNWLTAAVVSLAQAAYDLRADNEEAIAKLEKDIETQQFIMSQGPRRRQPAPGRYGRPDQVGCTSDGAYRVYQQHIDEFTKKLSLLRRQVGVALDPARLAVLSDALEEAGCDNEELLMHLRGWEPCQCRYGYGPPPGKPQCTNGWASSTRPHVRGCWALDLVLGKE
jgi:hypothetical protein